MHIQADTPSSGPTRQAVDNVYRQESRRVFATLIRIMGDFDLAERAMHEAFAAALEQWERQVCRRTREPGWSPPAGTRLSMDTSQEENKHEEQSGYLV